MTTAKRKKLKERERKSSRRVSKSNDVDEIFKTSILKNGVVKRLVATKDTWNELQIIRESNQ